MEISRRGLVTGLVSFVALAPAIVRSASLMPVRQIIFAEASHEMTVLISEDGGLNWRAVSSKMHYGTRGNVVTVSEPMVAKTGAQYLVQLRARNPEIANVVQVNNVAIWH